MLLLLHDVVTHLMDVYDLSDLSVDLRRAKRSAIAGFRRASTRHQWNVYDTQDVFTLNAPIVAGTIAISDAGVVTGTDVTFPAWAAEGSIVIGDDEMYRVSKRTSDTELQLESWRGTAQTSTRYKLVHNRKLLDYQPRSIHDVWNETEDCAMSMIVPEEFRVFDRYRNHDGGHPHNATIRAVTINGAIEYELRVSPYPMNPTIIDVAYTRVPRNPFWFHSVGIVDVSSEVATLETPLPLSLHGSARGAWMRLSNIGLPDADLDFGFGRESPIVAQGEIAEQTSQTTLSVPGIANLTNHRGLITDALDVPEFAYDALLFYAEAEMARIGTADLRKGRELQMLADEEMRYAMENEPRHQSEWHGTPQRVARLESMYGHYVVEVS